jgi:hypothetical protein
MREELDKKLCEKYPEIFAQRNGDMRETCMCWGFDCGNGWYNILDALCTNIQGHIDNRLLSIKWVEKWNVNVSDPNFEWPDYWSDRVKRTVPEPVSQVVATQVKEKFGTLRFYFMGGDDVIDGMVSMAESMSACMCEVCGAPATENQESGWIRTRCEEHKNV